MKKAKSLKTALCFLAPGCIIYAVFMLYPILQSIGLSLFEWSGYATVAPEFVGLQNYHYMFTDSIFYKALLNNLYIWE